MGRRRRRRNRGRSRTSRKSTSQATKQAVVEKKGVANQARAANVAAQQVQNQQAQGAMGSQIGHAGIAASMGDVMSGRRPASASGKQAGPKSPSKGMVGAIGAGLGRGRGERGYGAGTDRGTGGRDFGGGYRNRAFGMGRGERGYGMDRGRGGMVKPDFMGSGGGQDPNMTMNMDGGGGERGYGMGRAGRGFGMGGGGRNMMQSGLGGYGRQPQGRPNPYANINAGGAGGFTGMGPKRGGSVGGSSFNPASGRMEYASSPRNFSQRSQRGGKGGGFRGRRSNAFPAMAAMSGSPMHKKAEFRLLNQVLDSGGGESGNEFASSFANSFKSSQSTIEKRKSNKKS